MRQKNTLTMALDIQGHLYMKFLLTRYVWDVCLEKFSAGQDQTYLHILSSM